MSNDSLSGTCGLGTSELSRQVTRERLADFNRAVSHWSNQFAPELRRVAYVIGSRMGWDHNEFKISWKSLQRHYEKAHGETTSLNTLKKLARVWADAGGLKIIAGYRETVPARPKGYADRNGQQRGGSRQNADDSTTFHVDFGVVVKSRRVYTGKQGRPVTSYYTEPWSFGQTAQASEESQVGHGEPTIADPSMTPHSPLNDPSLTPYSSSDFSGYSPITLPSSGPDDDGHDEVSNQDQSQTQAPAGAEDYSLDSDEKAWVAEKIGVQVSDIDPPLWRLLERRAMEIDSDDVDGVKVMSDIIVSVAENCQRADNRVGYLYGILARDESFTRLVEEAKAVSPEEQAAAEEQARKDAVRAVLPNYIPRRVQPLGDHDGMMIRTTDFGNHHPAWYHRETDMIFVGKHDNDPGPGWDSLWVNKGYWKKIKDRKAIWLMDADELAADEERQRQAALQRDRDELEKILPELAELRFGGDIEAARDDIEIWPTLQGQIEKARMYIAWSRAGIGRAN